MENGKIIGWKDYYGVEGTYGERQGRARYIIEKEFNDTEASCHSITAAETRNNHSTAHLLTHHLTAL